MDVELYFLRQLSAVFAIVILTVLHKIHIFTLRF